MLYPRRIVCLTEETTETLYLLGAGDRVVGVSGYTVRPREAREKPKVSAFINARFDKIAALEPDLVLAFSDLQADIAAELIRRGYTVVTFNQRSVAEILRMIRMLGGLVGLATEADALARRLEGDLDLVRASARRFRAASAGVFRGMGRPADLGHPMGGRADPDRGRRHALSRAARRAGERSHRLPGGRPGCRARRHRGVLVRQKSEQIPHRGPAGLERRAGRPQRPRLRDQIDVHPAAGPGVTDRRRQAAARTALPRRQHRSRRPSSTRGKNDLANRT